MHYEQDCIYFSSLSLVNLEVKKFFRILKILRTSASEKCSFDFSFHTIFASLIYVVFNFNKGLLNGLTFGKGSNNGLLGYFLLPWYAINKAIQNYVLYSRICQFFAGTAMIEAWVMILKRVKIKTLEAYGVNIRKCER